MYDTYNEPGQVVTTAPPIEQGRVDAAILRLRERAAATTDTGAMWKVTEVIRAAGSSNIRNRDLRVPSTSLFHRIHTVLVNRGIYSDPSSARLIDGNTQMPEILISAETFSVIGPVLESEVRSCQYAPVILEAFSQIAKDEPAESVEEEDEAPADPEPSTRTEVDTVSLSPGELAQSDGDMDSVFKVPVPVPGIVTCGALDDQHAIEYIEAAGKRRIRATPVSDYLGYPNARSLAAQCDLPDRDESLRRFRADRRDGPRGRHLYVWFTQSAVEVIIEFAAESGIEPEKIARVREAYRAVWGPLPEYLDEEENASSGDSDTDPEYVTALEARVAELESTVEALATRSSLETLRIALVQQIADAIETMRRDSANWRIHAKDSLLRKSGTIAAEQAIRTTIELLGGTGPDLTRALAAFDNGEHLPALRGPLVPAPTPRRSDAA